MQEPLVSIIVPVYNVQNYLNRCLDSIAAQTYENFECILIDDGSTDKSRNICDQIVIKDARFKCIHQENNGLSVARNNGMEIARGKYISFIDSDDYVLPDYLYYLVHAIMQSNSEISKCDYFKGEIVPYDEKEDQVMDASIFNREILLDNVGSQLWQYLFKKELWNSISSPQGRYAQDMMILHKVIHKAKKIAIVNKKLYFYFIDRNDSTSNNPYKKAKGAFDRSIAFKERFTFARKNGYDECCMSLLSQTLNYYNNALVLKKSSDQSFDSDIMALSQFIRKEICWNNNFKFSVKYKILSFLLAYFPKKYCKIRGILK